ncbi:DUF1045 domain-containing protein [Celeribacter sp.]|uniref:DUF1045 domain-containing protein n=1 Tax=Celeribacter sp. TaxID=1890673 RepID=UPI003A90C1B7
MEKFTRFAVYFAPPEGALWEFTARWLGWDALAGVTCAHPLIEGLPAPAEEITVTPRKYGFHGTIKPPFRLADGATREALEADLAALATQLSPVWCDGLALKRLGGFLALVPVGETSDLATLASEVVKSLDHHRAPPSEAELARRRGAGLSPAQEENLARWGYPYVMDEFKFHLTLTGNLAEEDARAVEAALRPHLAPLLPTPFIVPDLCLFGEAQDGRFHLLHRYALSG